MMRGRSTEVRNKCIVRNKCNADSGKATKNLANTGKAGYKASMQVDLLMKVHINMLDPNAIQILGFRSAILKHANCLPIVEFAPVPVSITWNQGYNIIFVVYDVMKQTASIYVGTSRPGVPNLGYMYPQGAFSYLKGYI